MKTKSLLTLAITLLLTGTAHSLRADDSPLLEVAPVPEEIRHQHEELLRIVKQKVDKCCTKLRQVDRTKLILTSVPCAAALPQLWLSGPGPMSTRIGTTIGTHYQRLMGKRWLALAFAESLKELTKLKVQRVEVSAMVNAVVNETTVLMRMIGRERLPIAKIGAETVRQLQRVLREKRNLATN